jgi:hypothetical protein
MRFYFVVSDVNLTLQSKGECDAGECEEITSSPETASAA